MTMNCFSLIGWLLPSFQETLNTEQSIGFILDLVHSERCLLCGCVVQFIWGVNKLMTISKIIY